MFLLVSICVHCELTVNMSNLLYFGLVYSFKSIKNLRPVYFLQALVSYWSTCSTLSIYPEGRKILNEKRINKVGRT